MCVHPLEGTGALSNMSSGVMVGVVTTRGDVRNTHLEAVLRKAVGQKQHADAIGKTRGSGDRCPADLPVNQGDAKKIYMDVNRR